LGGELAQRRQTPGGAAQLSYRLSPPDGYREYLSRLAAESAHATPGETNWKWIARQIRHRISTLKRDIENIRKHRQLIAEHRRRDQLRWFAGRLHQRGEVDPFPRSSKEDTLTPAVSFHARYADPPIQLSRNFPILISDTSASFGSFRINSCPHPRNTGKKSSSGFDSSCHDASDPTRRKQQTVLMY